MQLPGWGEGKEEGNHLARAQNIVLSAHWLFWEVPALSTLSLGPDDVASILKEMKNDCF